MKRILALLLVLSAVLALAACSKSPAVTEDEGTTLVYGSGDYTRINPAMDEHGEINVLLFSGLTAHNGSNEVVARSGRIVGIRRERLHLHLPPARRREVA